MSFTEILNNSEEKIQKLFYRFDKKVSFFAKPYTTNSPDYRIKHPCYNYVFCVLKPMIRSSSLRVKMRVDSAAIPGPKHEINITDIVPPPTGKRWIKMELTSEDDVEYVLKVIDSIVGSENT
ncbi:hypothetical protein I6L39_17745 [Aeromonas sp. FDAARGOS 1409]|uniref:hypothetical protein n=1 Tax=Aeromonas TaxID=642 RepID=UPI001C239AC5|nr:hypothetical protein [Aeromonas sp. FDAARGOS 1409]QXC29707.1 hypothetical protein I6L39_17745 [Aeromonas sp. FDAARGOS 1409]